MSFLKTPTASSGRSSRLPSNAAMRPPKTGRFYDYRGAVLLALAVLVIWLNLTFLIPLTTGTIFAVVLYPCMKKMRNWRVNEMIKAALVTVLFAVSFLVPIGSIVFLGAEAALSKIQELQESGMNANQISPAKAIDLLGLKPFIDKISDITPASEEQIRQVASRGLAAGGSWAIQVLQGFLAGLPGALVTLIFIMITIFFLLIDGHTAVSFLRENSIFDRRQTERIFATVASLCYSVVVASIAAGLVQGIFVAFACGVTGTKGWLLISLLTFVASFLPVVGTLPVTIGLAGHAFLKGDIHSGIIFIVFMVLVIISDNVARTYVLKGGAELHPLVGLVAAFGALDMIGFYGVFIGPVVVGLFFALLPLITRSYGKVQRSL